MRLWSNGLPRIGLDVRYANQAYIKHGENGWRYRKMTANQYIAYLEQFSQCREKNGGGFSARSKELATSLSAKELLKGKSMEKSFKLSKIGD